MNLVVVFYRIHLLPGQTPFHQLSGDDPFWPICGFIFLFGIRGRRHHRTEINKGTKYHNCAVTINDNQGESYHQYHMYIE